MEIEQFLNELKRNNPDVNVVTGQRALPTALTGVDKELRWTYYEYHMSPAPENWLKS